MEMEIKSKAMERREEFEFGRNHQKSAGRNEKT
jgi:hypothetical protein